MSAKEKFEELEKAWAEHRNRVWFSSKITDRLDHPAFREIINLGWEAIPWIMELYQKDRLVWGFVLQEITGVQMIKNKNFFSPSEVRQQWLDWWSDQQRLGFPAMPVSDGAAAPTQSN